ncbi:hypothetical protein JCM10908_002371 [Rhodotorula pacifica]|uniref:Con-6 family protein n=1 Tax=Rhodotorula pacifica TaxID=1495444 RepID=UPI00316DDA2A
MAPHTLTVEDDKVIEKSASGEVIKTSDYHHVIGGYKATLARDNASEEAKAEARELLHDLQKAHKPFEEAGEAEEPKHTSGHHQRRKSVSKHVESEETHHEHKHGEPRPLRYEAPGDEVPLPHEGETHEEEVHRHRVAGSFKGLLHNKNSSDEAKAHAREVLDRMGVEYEE